VRRTVAPGHSGRSATSSSYSGSNAGSSGRSEVRGWRGRAIPVELQVGRGLFGAGDQLVPKPARRRKLLTGANGLKRRLESPCKSVCIVPVPRPIAPARVSRKQLVVGDRSEMPQKVQLITDPTILPPELVDDLRVNTLFTGNSEIVACDYEERVVSPSDSGSQLRLV